MKKSYLFIALAICIAFTIKAQTPAYYNYSGGIANAFPLNSTGTQRKVQWFVPAASLGTLTTGLWTITKVYFQAGSSATQVYPIITVKLKSGGSMTGLSGSVMEPSMTVVYTTTNYTLSTSTGNWFSFLLQTPFTYDPTQPLIVEMEHNATSGTGPTVYQTAISASTYYRQWGDYNNNSVSGADMARQIDFGIDCVPACNVQIGTAASGTNNAAICNGSSITLTTTAISNYSWSNGSTASSIVVSPSLTTVYSLTATSTPSNCTGSRSFTVNVNSSAPVLTVASSASSVCIGQTATLTASGAITYTWSHGAANGATFTPTTTAVYTVSGQNGCGITTSTISIAAAPLPVSIAAGAPSVCAGSAVNFSTTAAASSFSWMPQNSSTASSVIAVSPTATTLYTVTASDGTCSGTQTINLVAQPVPTVTIAGTGSTVCQGGSVTMTVTGGNSYTWNPPSLIGNVVTAAPATTTLYTATGNNNFGCTSTANYLVLVQTPPTLNGNFSNTMVCAGSTIQLVAGGASTYTWSTGGNTSSVVVTASTNTVVTVYATGTTNTCVASLDFTVNAASAVLPVSPSATICNGAAITLTVGATSNISWSPVGGGFPSITVNPSVTTTYTVAADVNTLSLVCPTVNTILVTVNPKPNVTASAQRTLMCKNEINHLTATGAVTYNWSNQQSGASVNYTATQSGGFNVTVIGLDANGCSDTATVKITVNSCNGISARDIPSLKVYPVPSDGTLFIEGSSDCTLTIINTIGQPVRTVVIGADYGYKASVSGLSAGIYFVRSETGEMVKRVVVE